VAVIQLSSIRRAVFVLEKHCVFLEVAVVTEILIIISVWKQLHMYYKYFLMMARVVCRNMLENWQRVTNSLSAYKVGSTSCHTMHGTYNIKISNIMYT